MANEATIRVSLTIKKGRLSYQSNPTAFTATLSGTKGPTPGAIEVSVYGTEITFSELTQIGYCVMQNLDEDNFVQWGLWEPATAVFYPVGELGPGELCLFKFSRYFKQEYTNTGTGTTAPENSFMLKADTANCNCVVTAFEA